MRRLQGLSRNEHTQSEREEAQRTAEDTVNLPYFEHPKNDNERLLNYQYDFIVNGSQEAWCGLWKLTTKVVGLMLAKECKERKIFFDHEEWKDKKSEAVIYILRRYKTHPGYCIKSSYPLHIWYAVKHVLDYRRRSDEIVDYVSGAELIALIEKQNKEKRN